jgi:diguanylate cyclase (GGDEF)-like protein/PAS domain S-box-containing protein
MEMALQIEAIYQRALALQQRASATPLQPDLLAIALHDLYGVLEELRTAQEEILQQNQALVEAHQVIELERQRYQDLFNLAPQAYLVTDAKGCIQEANHAVAALLNRPPAYLIGKPLVLFVEESNRTEFYTNLGAINCRCHQPPPEIESWDMILCPHRGTPMDVVATLSITRLANGTVASLRWLLRDITQEKQALDQIRRQAFYDPLTELPNRTFFDLHLTKSLAQATRQRQQLAIIFIDLDGFKEINDSLGHAMGDLTLKATGHRLAQGLREEDVLVRWGGDEFALIVYPVETLDAITQVCERIQANLKPGFPIHGQTIRVSSSMGIALFPHHGNDAISLMRQADLALYRAKDTGRNTYEFNLFPPSPTEAER